MIKQGLITIMVADMGKAKLFYTQILGMEVKEEYGEDWISLEGYGIRIGLHPSLAKVEIKGNLSIGFDVIDLDKEIENLQKKGISCRVRDEGFLRLAFFNDPDGTPLYFAENAYS